VLSGTLTQFGLPLQGVALILGVDAFMDMARTSLNVLGNCLAAVLMARWDGSFVLSPEPDSGTTPPSAPRRVPVPPRVAEAPLGNVMAEQTNASTLNAYWPLTRPPQLRQRESS